MRTSSSRKPLTVGTVLPDEGWSADVLSSPENQLSGSGDRLDWFADPPGTGSYTVGIPVTLFGVTRDGTIRDLGRWPLGGIDLTVADTDLPIERLLSIEPPEGIVGLYAKAATVTGTPSLHVRDVLVKEGP